MEFFLKNWDSLVQFRLAPNSLLAKNDPEPLILRLCLPRATATVVPNTDNLCGAREQRPGLFKC